jgi:Ca-activated chloride channel family protein
MAFGLLQSRAPGNARDGKRHFPARIARRFAISLPATRLARARQWPRRLEQHERDTAMTDTRAGDAGGFEGAAADFLPLIIKAVVAGVGAATTAAIVVVALVAATEAAAAPVTLNEARTGTLMLRTAEPGRFVEAPRVETEVAIRVTGVIARTRLTQVFHNPGAEPAEGVYVFPLPEKAAVDRLQMAIGTRTIEGVIREKEEARRTYEKAKGEGRKASLVEQQRPNLFTNSVAHIGAGEMVRVTLEYQQSLASERGEYRVRFPLAVAPRYTPAVPAPEAIPDEPKTLEARALPAGLLHPDYAPPGSGAVNPVDIVVMIDAGAPLEFVSSSYHEAVVEKSGGDRALVHLVKDQEAADRDFELVWRPTAGSAPKAALFTERVGDAAYALVMVTPPEPDAQQKARALETPRETILVIDTSGSMAGAPLEQAKAALTAALATLRPQDRFNLVEFNSGAWALFPEALPATRTTLERAREWIASLKARGGTEMALALRLALPVGEKARTPVGFLRQVIFATDGAVGNEDELFGLIHARLGSSRLFTVGIGAAPNGHFMTKAAQFGRGTFTYIGSPAEAQEKMAGLFAKLEAPVLTDVTIRFADGTPVETYPARIPDLYLGEPIVASASAADFSRTLVVAGLRGNVPWSVALTPPPSEGGPSGVGALWARARIAALMDAQRTGADPAVIRPAVVKVALEHHLVSAYTSLVAVDTTPTAVPEAAKTALVKANLPQGWEAAAGQIPQTDTASTLQLLLGLLALAAAGIVAVIGRETPAAAGGRP